MTVSSSEISPLRIDSVVVPGTTGRIGMTGCPGRDEYGGIDVYCGSWKRDLDDDLRAIRAWGARALVSLVEGHEFVLLGVPEFPDKVRALGIPWFHLPIVDLCVPDGRFEEKWASAGRELRRILADGGGIVLHCRAGLGRTGTMAARLLMEFGMDPHEAIARVRLARPGAIQTRVQEEYVLKCERVKGESLTMKISPLEKGREMYKDAEFFIFDEEIKDKLRYDRQSAYNDIAGIFAFACDVLRTGGRVTIRRHADEDISITDEAGLNVYKEGFNKIQREQNRRLI